MHALRTILPPQPARRIPRGLALLFVLTSALQAGIGISQEPSPGLPILREEVEVRLVTVEVLALDRGDLPIFGLGASDFEVLHDGTSVELAGFVAPRPPVPGAREADHATAKAGRERPLSLVLCVDSTFLVPGDLDRLSEPIRGFLLLTLRQGDRAMLLDCHSDPAPRVAPTSSADTVVDGFAALAGELHTSRLSSEYRSILRELEQILGRGSPRLAPLNRETAPQLLRSRIDIYSDQARRELGDAARRLSRAVDSVDGLPGRVELLYVAGRPPRGAVSALYEAWKSAFGRSSGYSESIESAPGAELANEGVGMVEFDSSEVGPAGVGVLEPFRAAARHAALRNVRIHILEAGGLVAPSALMTSQTGGEISLSGAGVGFSTSLDADQGIMDLRELEEVAEITGGRTLLSSVDAEVELSGLSALLDSYYSLVIPMPPDSGSEPHRLEVRLVPQRPGTMLRHRRLYRERDPDELAGARAVSTLLLGTGDNPLGVELETQPTLRASRRRFRIPLTVGLPFSRLALLPQGRSHAGSLSVFLVSVDAKGLPSPIQKAVLPVRVDNSELLTSLGRRVEYSVELTVPAGTHRVAVGVRDDVANTTSTTWIEVSAGSGESGS